MYSINRRTFAAGMVMAAAAPAVRSQPAWAPTKPVSFVVPFSAGGPTDAIARALAEGLTKTRGQQGLVESRPGAGGGIAYEHVLRSPPDGHRLGMIGSSMVANSTLGPVSY